MSSLRIKSCHIATKRQLTDEIDSDNVIDNFANRKAKAICRNMIIFH